MELKKSAIAGTLESSDVQVMIEPGDEGLSIELHSSVKKQYEKQILDTIYDVLAKLEVSAANLVIQDQGALDCTIRSRVQTAVLRACGASENLPWGTKL